MKFNVNFGLQSIYDYQQRTPSGSGLWSGVIVKYVEGLRKTKEEGWIS